MRVTPFLHGVQAFQRRRGGTEYQRNSGRFTALPSNITGVIARLRVLFKRTIMFFVDHDLRHVDGVPLIDIMANVINCASEDLRIGLPVKLCWLPLKNGAYLPAFEPKDNP